jgi:hypothetical protein
VPGNAYRMSGMGASFRPARACPVTTGPHVAPLDRSEGALVVADVTTRDASVGVRVVLWRCAYCGIQLTGLGRNDAPVGDGSPGTGLDVQEFTWLEEAPVPLLAAVPGCNEAPGYPGVREQESA